jgi:hypothetical protein
MINSMTKESAGKPIKTHRWRKWTTNANKHNKTITALHNNRPTIGMIVTSAQIAIAIVITTKTNEQEMIMVYHTREIAPTPKRAVRAAEAVITTETVHTSTMRKMRTRNQTTHDELHTEPHTKQREAYTQENKTQSKNHQEKQKTIKSKDKIKKPITRHHEYKNETRQRNTKNICTRALG